MQSRQHDYARGDAGGGAKGAGHDGREDVEDENDRYNDDDDATRNYIVRSGGADNSGLLLSGSNIAQSNHMGGRNGWGSPDIETSMVEDSESAMMGGSNGD
jgi:hypothetical protein